MAHTIPSQMKAVRYNKIRDFELVRIPVPEPQPHEILIKSEYHLFALTGRACCPALSSITHLTDVMASQIMRNLWNRPAYPWWIWLQCTGLTLLILYRRWLWIAHACRNRSRGIWNCRQDWSWCERLQYRWQGDSR